MNDPVYLLGQFLGVVAILLGFLTFQMKSREKLVFLQIAVTLAFVLHYYLIGAYSGMAMNSIAMIRNIVFYFIGKNKPVPKYCSILFTVVLGVMGILSWQAWYSIFVVLGLLINSYCMSFSDPQNIRKSILISSPLVLVYDCFVLSFGGIVYESVAVISAAIGIIRSRKSVSST